MSDELHFSPEKLLEVLKEQRLVAKTKKDALTRSAPDRLRGHDAVQYTYDIAVNHGKEMAYDFVIDKVEDALRQITERAQEKGGS